MGWSVTSEVIFGAFAALAQLFIALALLTRDPRNERISLLGALFLINGVSAASTMYRGGLDVLETTDPLLAAVRRVQVLAEFITNILILLFALVYPHRARFLPRRGLWAWGPLLAIGLVFGLHVLLPDGIASFRAPGHIDFTTALVGFLLVELSFPVLLIRWTRQWNQRLPRQLRRQFLLIFAAFSVRAFHVIPLTLNIQGQRFAAGSSTATAPATALLIALALLMIASLVHCAATLIRNRARHPGTWVLLVFIAFGSLEGLAFSLAELRLSERWIWATVWGHLDVLVIRPALVWFAIARFGFSQRTLRSRTFAWWFLGLLMAAVLTNTFYEVLRLPVWSRLITAFALASLATALLIQFVRYVAIKQRPMGLDDADSRLQAYATNVEEAARHGEIRPRDAIRLAVIRDALGIEGSQHEAILAGLRGDHPDPAEWSPGTVVMERYSLEHHLPGSTSHVWKAHDILSEETVVLKSARPELDPDTVRREWRSLQRINHPNVLAPLRLEWSDGTLFLVYPYFAEGTLAGPNGRRFNRHDIRLQLSAALRAVHKAGITHGDIKPANVLIQGKRLILTDFGNTGGGRFGTPAFIAQSSDPTHWTVDDDWASMELLLDACQRGDQNAGGTKLLALGGTPNSA